MSSGCGGMADAPDLGSGAERRKSSSLFVRTTLSNGACGSSSVVECHLAKVDVAGPNPVYRSTLRCHSQAVRRRSAKPLFPGPIPGGASMYKPLKDI